MESGDELTHFMKDSLLITSSVRNSVPGQRTSNNVTEELVREQVGSGADEELGVCSTGGAEPACGVL